MAPTFLNQTLRSQLDVVEEGDADMTSCHYPIQSRLNFRRLDYILPTLISTNSLVYDEEQLSLARDVFVETFSSSLWLCFFAAFLLLILCFRFSTYIHSKVRPDHEPWSWVEVILWAVAAVCQQSYSRYPKGLSCRTTFIIGYMIAYLLYTGFAAGVTSLLAVQSERSSLNLDDVLSMKLSLVIPLTANNPFESTVFNWKYRGKEKRIKFLRVRSFEQLFHKLNNSNHVGFGSTIRLQQYLQGTHLHRHFTMKPQDGNRIQEALFLSRLFPSKKKINYWLLRMMETGVLQAGRARFLFSTEVTKCCEPSGWSSASLSNVYSAILILLSGYFLSVLILFAEMTWMRKITGSKWENAAKRDVAMRTNQPR